MQNQKDWAHDDSEFNNRIIKIFQTIYYIYIYATNFDYVFSIPCLLHMVKVILNWNQTSASGWVVDEVIAPRTICTVT